MDAKKCDRCGKYYILKYDYKTKFKCGVVMLFGYKYGYRSDKADISAELCVECREDFEKWVKFE